MDSYRDLDRKQVEDYADSQGLKIETQENYREVAINLFNTLKASNLSELLCEISTGKKDGLWQRAKERGCKPIELQIIETYIAMLTDEEAEFFDDIYVYENRAGHFLYWRVAGSCDFPWKTKMASLTHSTKTQEELIQVINILTYL